MDWSEKALCIKCNEGGNLLVCSENGCPLAIHEGCTGCPARFDDAGCYYCPYCFYKQAVAEARKAREYALEKKKALLLFMDETMMGCEKHTEENKRAENSGRNESKDGEANENIITCSSSKSKVNRDASPEQSMQPEKDQKVDNAEEEKVQKEDSEDSSGSKGQDHSPKLREERRISNEVDKNNQEENQSICNEETKNQEEEKSIGNGGKKNREEEHETSAASSGENPSRNMHKNNIFDFEKEKIQEEQCKAPSPSSDEDPLLTVHARTTRRSGSKKSVKRDSEAVSARTSPTMNPLRESSRRSSSATETRKGSNHVDGSLKRLKQPEKSPLKLASNAFGSGKRKKLFWTEAEEDALKAGVERFSKEANINIPWRKILLFGEKVFHATRTPSDLKDKWRNMSAK